MHLQRQEDRGQVRLWFTNNTTQTHGQKDNKYCAADGKVRCWGRRQHHHLRASDRRESDCSKGPPQLQCSHRARLNRRLARLNLRSIDWRASGEAFRITKTLIQLSLSSKKVAGRSLATPEKTANGAELPKRRLRRSPSTAKTRDNNALIRSGEAGLVGWSRSMLY